MLYTIWCILVGETTPFSVKIDQTASVYKLQDHIKKREELTLDASELTLYKIDVDATDKNTYIPIVQDISQDLSNINTDKATELDVVQELSDVFGMTHPSKERIHILVVPPAVAAGPKPPEGFQLYDGPLTALYKTFWGQPGNLEAHQGGDIKFPYKTLESTGHRLYLFKQYAYLRDRIDAFRARDTSKEWRSCVIVTGTPGIGITTFLHYYLAYQLSKEERTFFYSGTVLYLFEKDHIYSTSSDDINYYQCSGVPCLLDMDGTRDLPAQLIMSGLFILQATSNPIDIKWVKQRFSSVRFVLNPPGEDEIENMLKLHHEYSSFADSVRDTFKKYGGNIQTLHKVLVAKQEEIVKRKINAKVSNITLATLHSMLKYGGEITNHASHSIIQTSCPKQPKQLDDDYFKNDDWEYSISCPVVLTSLHKQFGEYLFAEQSILSRLLRSIRETAATVGHTLFCKGGDFTLVRMMKGDGKRNCLIQVNESKTISIKSMTLTILDKNSVCQLGEYCISASESEPMFDACFLLNNELIALQFTISNKHTTKDDGFLTLIEMQPKTCTERSLVYVVPKARAERFTCDAPSDYRLQTFKFYVLALDFPLANPSDLPAENEDATDIAEEDSEE